VRLNARLLTRCGYAGTQAPKRGPRWVEVSAATNTDLPRKTLARCVEVGAGHARRIHHDGCPPWVTPRSMPNPGRDVARRSLGARLETKGANGHGRTQLDAASRMRSLRCPSSP
jgi:hypothetical protein